MESPHPSGLGRMTIVNYTTEIKQDRIEQNRIMGEAWKKWPYFLHFDQLYTLKGLHLSTVCELLLSSCSFSVYLGLFYLKFPLPYQPSYFLLNKLVNLDSIIWEASFVDDEGRKFFGCSKVRLDSSGSPFMMNPPIISQCSDEEMNRRDQQQQS